MRRQAFIFISMLSLLLTSGPAVAQTIHFSANIPFAFTVAGAISGPQDFEFPVLPRQKATVGIVASWIVDSH